MKISDYMPNLYKNNVEMNNIIYSEEQELETILKPYIDNAFKDNFPKVATEHGIENYEKLLNIDLDENKDNLEYRRARVLAKLTTTVPLTYRWLENNLINLVGENNYKIDIDYNNYKINISIGDIYNNTAETLYDIYRPLLPANMIIIISTFEEETANIYTAGIIHEGEIVTYKMAIASESEV